ncbi:transposase, partial [Streptomyces sioyaensis]
MGASKYSPEFRADAVALYRATPGGTYASVAKDLDVDHETLRTSTPLRLDLEVIVKGGGNEATGLLVDQLVAKRV